MNKFGSQLQFWRKNRHLSQLQLAMDANVSARHISFLETGRAAPSRPMVQHLINALRVPTPRRNDLFEAAGFSRQHSESKLSDEHMEMLSSALSLMLERHAPYPAYVFNAEWEIVEMNEPAKTLFMPTGLTKGSSLLEFITTPNAAAQIISNWAEVGHHLLQRLKTESRAAGGLPLLDDAIEALSKDAIISSYTPPTVLPPVLTTNYAVGPINLEMFAIISQFGSAEDLTVSDLKIELLFPANAETEALLKSL